VHVVILGGSFAGLEAAKELRRVLPSAQVTVIDRSDRFLFRPSLPWVVFGYRRLHEITVPLAPLLHRHGVRFVRADIEAIDPIRQEVAGKDGRWHYDVLLIALGATSPPDDPPYLARHGYRALWADDGLAMKRAIDSFSGGPVVIVFCANSPLACPIYELMFHLDRALRRRGLRDRSSITVISYEEKPFAAGGDGASRIVAGWMRRRGIHFRAASYVRDAGPDYVELSTGERLPAALLLYMPGAQGPAVVRQVPELTDGEGFVLVDRSLQTDVHANMFAAGDIVAFPGVKNGRMAEIQGTVAARNIAATIKGEELVPYSSHMACVLDLGGRQGLAVVRKPAPMHGPTRTFVIWPGWLPHVAKLGLERYYMDVKLRR